MWEAAGDQDVLATTGAPSVEDALADEYAALYGDGNHCDPEAWKLDGLCRQADPEAFFPEKGSTSRLGKAVCWGKTSNVGAGCPVQSECLAYALRGAEQFGTWGGLTAKERRRWYGPPAEAGARMYGELEQEVLALSVGGRDPREVAAIVQVSVPFVTRALAREEMRGRAAGQATVAAVA